MGNLTDIYRQLLKRFKPQGWWPLSELNFPVKEKDKDWPNYLKVNPKGTEADFIKNWPRHLGVSPKTDNQIFEVIIGAILTQNTNWKNVEKAVYGLNSYKLVSIEKIKKIPIKKLAQIIRPSGYYNQKAERLKIISGFLMKNPIRRLKNLSIPELRKELLEIKGIGPETADSIILYAFEKPIFVVDAYTRRIMSRLGYKEKGYDGLQQLFMEDLPKNTNLYKEYHALFVELGKNFCKTKPLCISCVLKCCNG